MSAYMVFSSLTVEYFGSNAVIGYTSKGHGEGVTGLCASWYLVLTSQPPDRVTSVFSVPQRTSVLCVFMVFLCFGGITVLVEALMTKFAVCAYHGQWVLNVVM